MLKALTNLFRKRSLLKSIDYITDESEFIFGSTSQVHTHNSSKIELNGKLFLGISLTGNHPSYAHKSNTVLTMAENSTLIIKGDVQIAPGCTLKIGKGATLELHGQNLIAHDTTIIASKKVIIGKNTSISWNVTLIDDDTHTFYQVNGRKFKRIRRSLIIGNNVGIQMNVVIPSGCIVGNNSIISANSVIRKDVPADSLIYTSSENKIMYNITTGFQFL